MFTPVELRGRHAVLAGKSFPRRRRERRRPDKRELTIYEPAFIMERAVASRSIEQLGQHNALKLWLHCFYCA